MVRCRQENVFVFRLQSPNSNCTNTSHAEPLFLPGEHATVFASHLFTDPLNPWHIGGWKYNWLSSTQLIGKCPKTSEIDGPQPCLTRRLCIR